MAVPLSSKQRQQQFRLKAKSGSIPEKPEDAAGTATSEAKPPARPDRATRKRYLRQYIAWLWPYRVAIFALFFLALIGAGLDMVWPLAVKHIIDNILPGEGGVRAETIRQLHITGLAVLGLLLVKQTIDSIRSYRTSLLNARVVFRLRRRLFSRLLRLPMGKL